MAGGAVVGGASGGRGGRLSELGRLDFAALGI
jgi:hypothetical protein